MADIYSVPHSPSPDSDAVYPRGFAHTHPAVCDPIADANLDADIGVLTSSAHPDTRPDGDGRVNTRSYPDTDTYNHTYTYAFLL